LQLTSNQYPFGSPDTIKVPIKPLTVRSDKEKNGQLKNDRRG